MTERVEFFGEELPYIACALAISLTELSGDDYEIADHLLDRTVAAFPRPIDQKIMDAIETLRSRKGVDADR